MKAHHAVDIVEIKNKSHTLQFKIHCKTYCRLFC